MPKLSPRLGYYVISLGTVIQFLGLSGDSWLSDSSSSSGNGTLAFSHPGDVMLVIGMALTVMGVILGFISLAESMPNERDRSPRLLPALPLVLLVGLSIGSVAFAFQAGDNPSSSAVASEVSGNAPTPIVIGTPGPEDCLEGTTWHPIMGHCMTPEAIAALENAQCQTGYVLDPETLTCSRLSVTADGETVSTGPEPGATPVCPNGFFWHPVMDHCMETSEVVCPAGYQWSTALLSCTTTSPTGTVSTPPPNQTPVCPADSFWHPVMNHCMSTVCPAGFQFDFTYETCLQVGPIPTSTPTATPTPIVTPTPPPGESCPDGYFWNPAKGHCDSKSCPDGLIFDWDVLYCVIPPATPTPPPSCPAGYFWHPAMGHCMSDTCPPGLEFDPVTLFCVLPGQTSEPTETPVPPPTATPTPLYDTCPDGYYWNPNKGHCDSQECPPPLIFDNESLYCVFPSTATPTPVPTDAPTPEPSCPSGYFWHPAMGHCMSEICPPGLVFDRDTLYCVLPP